MKINELLEGFEERERVDEFLPLAGMALRAALTGARTLGGAAMQGVKSVGTMGAKAITGVTNAAKTAGNTVQAMGATPQSTSKLPTAAGTTSTSTATNTGPVIAPLVPGAKAQLPGDPNATISRVDMNGGKVTVKLSPTSALGKTLGSEITIPTGAKGPKV